MMHLLLPLNSARLPASLLLAFVLTPGLAVAENAPAVTVAHPRERETANHDFKGHIESSDKVDVRSVVSGKVAKVHCQKGAMVKKGDLLIELDSGDLQKTIEQAEGEVKKLEGAVKKIDTTLEVIRKAQGKPADPLDLERFQAERNLAGVRLKLAKEEAERHRKNLELLKIKAPIGGVVTQVKVAEGAHVDASPRVQELLCQIQQADPVRVAVEIDEQAFLYLEELARADKISRDNLAVVKAFLGLANEKGFPHEGKLECVDNRVETKSHRIHVYGLFANPKGDLTPAILVPEKDRKPVHVRVVWGKPRKVSLIPPCSVGTDDEGKEFVLVVNDKDVIESRAIKRGSVVDGLQVITDGLKPTDWVVVHVDKENRDPSDKSLAPSDFVSDTKFQGLKPGVKVVRTELPDSYELKGEGDAARPKQAPKP
jgi:RND family efflux transporter MFP subunit